jgi:tetratricopeptide (TPR) repeat protein
MTRVLLAFSFLLLLLYTSQIQAQSIEIADKNYYQNGKKAFYAGDYEAAAVNLLYTSDKFRKSNPKAQYELLYACLQSRRINLGADAARSGYPMKGPKKMSPPQVVVEDLLGLESEYKQALVEARKALKDGQYKEALEGADFAIETDPNFPEAYIVRGRANLGLKSWRQASLDVEEIIQARLNDQEAYFVRAMARFGMGDEKNALEDLNTSIKIKPSAEANYRRGQYAVSQNQGRRAINDLFTAVRLDPEHWEARLLLGTVHLQEGDPEKALANFDEIIASKGGFKEVFFERARAQKALGNLEAALSDYRIFILANPKNSEAHYEVGVLLTETSSEGSGLADSALIHLNQAINLNPEDVRFRMARATLFSRKKRYAEGLKDIEAALRQDPGNFDLYAIQFQLQDLNKLGPARQIKSLEEALSFFRNETLRARKGPGFYNKARIFGLRNQLTPAQQWVDSAVVNIDEAIVNGRSEPTYHHERGLIFWKLKKQMEEAEKSLKQAVTIQPTVATFQVSLIELLMEKGDYKSAGQAMREAVKKVPGNKDLENLRSRLCQIYPEGC